MLVSSLIMSALLSDGELLSEVLQLNEQAVCQPEAPFG